MCGIYSCFYQGDKPCFQHDCIESRGPEETIIIDSGDGDGDGDSDEECKRHLAFYRLKIVGMGDGTQPFQTDDMDLMCNGEIYNYNELRTMFQLPTKTHSDCEVIMHMYRAIGIEQTVQMLHGEFAFILVDKRQKLVHFARDRFGVKPLYMSKVTAGNKISMLELSSLVGAFINKEDVSHTDPRTVYTYDLVHKTLSSQPYCVIQFNSMRGSPTRSYIYDCLKKAVRMRVEQSERKVGFLLSGGLDSSIILSIALNECKFTEPVDVFTFGFEADAPDVKAARTMVEFLKKRHGDNCMNWHLVVQPVQNGIAAFPEVINAIETYDTTTIRASVPMYLISKYIKEETDVRVIISGEGADELFGGYLYMMYAPNQYAYKAETLKLLRELYMYDCLRADRTTAAHGLEVRPPFLDQTLVDVTLNYSELIGCDDITKPVLRYIASDNRLLPEAILIGKKEAFSDAVGLSWQDAMENRATEMLQNEEGEIAYSTTITPASNTAKVFQTVFRGLFGPQWNLLPKLWVPNQQWVDTGGEPSARVLACYNATPLLE